MNEKEKKQLLLRLSPSLYARVCRMAEDDFRSINGEIEFLLTQAANARGIPPKTEATPDLAKP